VERIERGICIEDMMRKSGVLDTGVYQSIEGHPGIPTDIFSGFFGDGSVKVDANLPSKKVCGTELYFHVPSYICLHVYVICFMLMMFYCSTDSGASKIIETWRCLQTS